MLLIKKLLHPARAVNSFVMLADQNDLRHVCVIELVCECLSRCLYQSDRIFSPINHLRALSHTYKQTHARSHNTKAVPFIL
jgi:hypothetical protein